jgi:xanthine dehydrogenase YagR molybdenum-binding subunit
VAITGGTRLKDRVQFVFGAEFVEVRVRARTREIRVLRLVGAFAGGHIANTRTARSQLMGEMIWGIGSALHESTEMDKAAARVISTTTSQTI